MDYQQRSSSNNTFYAETAEVKDYYYWIAASYIDSVFTLNGSSRQFKQVASMHNTVVKDDKGRIASITHKVNNDFQYKVMRVGY